MDIDTLELKVNELITLCDDFDRKKTAVETDRHGWLQERSRLLEKNEQAKTKIEGMILRLKSLEQH